MRTLCHSAGLACPPWGRRHWAKQTLCRLAPRRPCSRWCAHTCRARAALGCFRWRPRRRLARAVGPSARRLWLSRGPWSSVPRPWRGSSNLSAWPKPPPLPASLLARAATSATHSMPRPSGPGSHAGSLGSRPRGLQTRWCKPRAHWQRAGAAARGLPRHGPNLSPAAANQLPSE
jgi:hypothetical protein